jgi:ribosomal protein L5
MTREQFWAMQCQQTETLLLSECEAIRLDIRDAVCELRRACIRSIENELHTTREQAEARAKRLEQISGCQVRISRARKS